MSTLNTVPQSRRSAFAGRMDELAKHAFAKYHGRDLAGVIPALKGNACNLRYVFGDTLARGIEKSKLNTLHEKFQFGTQESRHTLVRALTSIIQTVEKKNKKAVDLLYLNTHDSHPYAAYATTKGTIYTLECSFMSAGWCESKLFMVVSTDRRTDMPATALANFFKRIGYKNVVLSLVEQNPLRVPAGKKAEYKDKTTRHLQKTITALAKEKARLISLMQEKDDGGKPLAKTILELDKKITALKTALEQESSQRKQTESALEEIKGQLAQESSEVATLQEGFVQLETALKGMHLEKSRLQEMVDARESELLTLGRELKETSQLLERVHKAHGSLLLDSSKATEAKDAQIRELTAQLEIEKNEKELLRIIETKLTIEFTKARSVISDIGAIIQFGNKFGKRTKTLNEIQNTISAYEETAKKLEAKIHE